MYEKVLAYCTKCRQKGHPPSVCRNDSKTNQTPIRNKQKENNMSLQYIVKNPHNSQNVNQKSATHEESSQSKNGLTEIEF